MDLNTIIQTVLTVMFGALCWFIKRSISKFDDSISKMDEKIDDGFAKLDEKIVIVEQKNNDKCAELQKQIHSLKEEMPLVYTLRQDFLRVMNGVDDKLNKILYGRNGGNNSE